jgi:hypothetical protein
MRPARPNSDSERIDVSVLVSRLTKTLAVTLSGDFISAGVEDAVNEFYALHEDRYLQGEYPDAMRIVGYEWSDGPERAQSKITMSRSTRRRAKLIGTGSTSRGVEVAVSWLWLRRRDRANGR